MNITDPLIVGAAAGALWNLLNLWGLRRLSAVWMERGTSRGRAFAWVLVKFPCWYAVAVWLLTQSRVSPVGFGIGFTAVLVVAAILAMRASVLTHGQ